MKLKDTSLEWALQHLIRFYDSDFFPKQFEIDAIVHDWVNIKTFLQTIEVENYIPKTPYIGLAEKPKGSFRIVHQLEIIDSLIYTALIYENSNFIEEFRIPDSRKIACSYRIKCDTQGSFFSDPTTGYDDFLSSALELADDYEDGYVLVGDIADFYNQIYLHRVRSAFDESGSVDGLVVENFLSALNTNISRGVPIGPMPSVIIAEAIMADIDRKMLTKTDSFCRYVDDIYVFFDTLEEAKEFLHELTRYLYNPHRLVFSSEKTLILDVETFKEKYLISDDVKERQALHEKIGDLADGDYPSPEDEEKGFEDLEDSEKFKIRSEAYEELFNQSLSHGRIELGIMRHILRQAGRYKIRRIVPLIFKHFNQLLPVLRDVIIYLQRVINEKLVKRYERKFQELLNNDFIHLPYVNIWIFTLFQNSHFNSTNIKIDYSKILRVREQALIAKRLNDRTWVKDFKGNVDTLGFWDKRAVLNAGGILAKDEARHWLALELSKGDIVDKAICRAAIANFK